jgi:hypothetical protein
MKTNAATDAPRRVSYKAFGLDDHGGKHSATFSITAKEKTGRDCLCFKESHVSKPAFDDSDDSTEKASSGTGKWTSLWMVLLSFASFIIQMYTLGFGVFQVYVTFFPDFFLFSVFLGQLFLLC